jgi:serine/threonine protein kinase/tetratricopeptide (TPR) repeat protein
MGEVYRAHDAELGREVAVKIISGRAPADEATVERFIRETRAAASLSHPAIIAVHDVGTHEGSPFLVTELLEGETLRARIEPGPLSVRSGLDIAIQIAHGLAVAHARGILHRDLKPENLFLTADDRAKILDFGLAKLLPSPGAAAAELDVTAQQLTQAGAVLGTAAYMAPEQAEGRVVDHRADQFAFGVVLYEMFGGQRPFQHATVHATLAAILRDEPRSLASLRPELPDRLSRIVTRCLAKEPSARYESTRDLALALQEARDGLTAESRPHETVVRALKRRLSSVTTGLIVGVLLLVIGGVAWRWLAPSETPSVAVLPFSTIGAGDEYFADGITEAVTTELGRVGGLRVIASNSTFAYRDKTAFRDIGRELGVGLVVKGSVQRADGRVRIDVSLVNTRDDTALWSERYSRDMTDVLTVQDDIAQQIATTLSRTFGAAPTAKSPSLATTNPDAYDAYLLGVWHLKARSSTTTTGARTRLVAATEELARAVAHDRNFALARAALASAYTQRFFYEATDPVFEQKAFLEIERSLAINPDQAEAYLARAQLAWNLRNGFPHERAITDLQRALSINPNLADAFIELGKVYYHVGQTDKAVDASDQAQRLDPSSVAPANRRIGALIDAGRLEEVRHELDRHGTRLTPISRADALLAIGQPEEALQTLLPATSVESEDLESHIGATALLAVVYARLGRREDAERVVAAAIPVAENEIGLSHVHHAQFYIGSTLGVLGRYDEAVRWLTKAANEGYQSYPRFSTDQTLAPLKGHVGFAALLARLRQDRDRWQKTL